MRTGLSEQEQQQIRGMDVESLAKFVFRFLKEKITSDPDCSDFYPVACLRRELFLDAGKHDPAELLEAIALLERKGLVVRGFSYPSRTIRSEDRFIVHLTSIGMKSDFDDEILLLVDKPQEIVDALEQKIGTLDNVVKQYYLESLRAYQEGLYISYIG